VKAIFPKLFSEKRKSTRFYCLLIKQPL